MIRVLMLKNSHSKQKLCEDPVLQYPDFSKSFILNTDASGGGILSQREIHKDRPIAYASQTLTSNEIKYDMYEKKALTIIYCVNYIYMDENLP